jgi:hypothetical protein
LRYVEEAEREDPRRARESDAAVGITHDQVTNITGVSGERKSGRLPRTTVPLV